ncbi:MAG TPA: Daple, partial [Actinoplanes sp.]|nr:Daple [Actinoplanes sp.]
PSAEAPALARIATHLRRGDVVPVQERQEGFDVQDILAAVREVDGVRDASLRATPAGAHSLRLDLSDGADPAEVSRQVARLLQDRMGLDAAMPGDPPAALRPSSAPVSSPRTPLLPSQPSRQGRASASVAPVSSPVRPVSSPVRPVSSPASPMAPVSGIPASPAAPLGMAPPAAPLGTASPATAPRTAPPAVPSRTSPPATAPRMAPPAATPLMAPPPQITPVQPVISTPAALVPADASKPRPLDPGDNPGPRVIIENVHVNTFGADATVEVRLRAGGRTAAGVATGPAVDGYLLRLCATATAGAVDELLSTSGHPDGPARCFVEHAAAVSFGQMQVAVVVLLLSCGGGWVEQLAGSAVVTGDDRHAMVRATLAAVNRRLEALLA